MRLFRRLIIIALVIAFLAGMAGSYFIIKSRAYIWLSDYLFNSPNRAETDELTDIIFVVVDHWEPGGDPQILNTWMTHYRQLADRHIDADGFKLRHTWHYPLEQFRGDEVDSLVSLCREGYGDVEVHLHHKNDDSISLRRKFSDGIDSLRKHGALISPDGGIHFSFVHGNWALDNSRLEHNSNYCGVNNEISILLDLGCFLDCTFPALTQLAQPSFVNKIYYALDDPLKPKSYDRGTISHVGIKIDSNQLMLLEGPLIIDWSDWRFKTHPTIEDGNIYWEIPTSIHRFEQWLKAGISVKGRPNWIFIRPFMHGASLRRTSSFDNMLGQNIDAMLTAIEDKYNDGRKFRIHFMTTREAYNVIKAAEAGEDGNPNNYREFIIKPYSYSAPEAAARRTGIVEGRIKNR